MTHIPTPLCDAMDLQWRVVKWDSRRWAVMAGKTKIALFDNRHVANYAIAAANFFHGQDIPIERIEEGQFWLMADALHAARLAFVRIQNEGDAHSNAVATKALKALEI